VHKVNLALKAKVDDDDDEHEGEEDIEWCPEDTKYDYNKHMDLVVKAFWGKMVGVSSQGTTQEAKLVAKGCQCKSKNMLKLW
jgi:hypothetical protein